eukprot:6173960-Pleurochrysis_carterae.AAC.3
MRVCERWLTWTWLRAWRLWQAVFGACACASSSHAIARTRACASGWAWRRQRAGPCSCPCPRAASRACGLAVPASAHACAAPGCPMPPLESTSAQGAGGKPTRLSEAARDPESFVLLTDCIIEVGATPVSAIRRTAREFSQSCVRKAMRPL